MCPTQSLWLNKRPHDSRAEQKGPGKVGLSYEELGGSPIGPRALPCSRAGLFPQPQSPLSALLLGCRCGGCLHPGLGEGLNPPLVEAEKVGTPLPHSSKCSKVTRLQPRFSPTWKNSCDGEVL